MIQDVRSGDPACEPLALSSFLIKSFKVFSSYFYPKILASFVKHFNVFPASNILLYTYVLLLKAPCPFVTDTVYEVINFCNVVCNMTALSYLCQNIS